MYLTIKSRNSIKCYSCFSKLKDEVFKFKAFEKEEFCSRTCVSNYEDGQSFGLSGIIEHKDEYYQHGFPLHDNDENCCKR
jgi:hypothetical protein